MERRDFLRISCLGCARLTVGAGLLSLTGCAALPLVKVESDGQRMEVPASAFAEGSSVIARTPELSYDVLVIKLPGGGARALYLRCTHEDQPLTATASGLHCPSHGSRFALDGSVEEGPATVPLRTFTVRQEADLYIVQLRN